VPYSAQAIIARVHSAASSSTSNDPQALLPRIELLTEENRWRKAKLFGRSTEKTPIEELNPDQASLFNEAEALAQASERAPVSVTIPAHERGKGGCKKLPAALPCIEVVHDLAEDQKTCAVDGTALKRIGEEISEQLDFRPTQAITMLASLRSSCIAVRCRPVDLSTSAHPIVHNLRM
jgi:transposase